MLNPKKIRQHEGKIIFLMSLWQARKIAAFVQRATSQTTYPAHVAKKIIHRNVGTKGNSKNDTEKMYVEWITTLIVTHHSLSPMLYAMTCVYVYLYFYLTYSARFLLPPHIFLYVRGLHVRPAAVCGFYATMDEHHLHLFRGNYLWMMSIRWIFWDFTMF